MAIQTCTLLFDGERHSRLDAEKAKDDAEVKGVAVRVLPAAVPLCYKWCRKWDESRTGVLTRRNRKLSIFMPVQTSSGKRLGRRCEEKMYRGGEGYLLDDHDVLREEMVENGPGSTSSPVIGDSAVQLTEGRRCSRE